LVEHRNGTSRLHLVLLGMRILVEADHPPIVEHVARCFGPAAHPARGEDGPCDLRLTLELDDWTSPSGVAKPRYRAATEPPGVLPLPFVSARDGAADLAPLLRTWAVANSSSHYSLHAGAVARKDMVVLLPGASRSGKSTLTTALVARGYELISDELASVEVDSGRLETVRMPISLRDDVLDVLHLGNGRAAVRGPSRSHRVAPSEVGGRYARAGGVPCLVVAPRYRHGTSAALEHLRPASAVVMLMDVSCSRRRFGARGLDLVIDLVRRLPCYRLTYSDARDAARVIDGLFDEGDAEAK
jgi:hypothetical protein